MKKSRYIPHKSRRAIPSEEVVEALLEIETKKEALFKKMELWLRAEETQLEILKKLPHWVWIEEKLTGIYALGFLDIKEFMKLENQRKSIEKVQEEIKVKKGE